MLWRMIDGQRIQKLLTRSGPPTYLSMYSDDSEMDSRWHTIALMMIQTCDTDNAADTLN